MLKNLLITIVTATAGLGAAEGPRVQEAWRLADDARVLARDGNGDQALELYRQALEAAPDVMQIRRDYATVLGWMGHYEDASREFGYVFALSPEQPGWALQEAANAHFFGGAEEAALEAFDRLIAAGYGQETNLTRRGLTLLRLGRVEESEQQYRQALAAYPESEPAAVGLARAMAKAGRPESAHALAVSWGAQAAPDSEIRLVAAEMLVRMGRSDEALPILAGMSLARREQPEVAAVHAEAMRLSGEIPRQTAGNVGPPAPPSALADAAVGDAGPSWSRTLRAEGVRLAREGNVELGLEHLELALKVAPDDLDVARDYAIVLGWAERYPASLEQFARVLEAQPKQPIWTRVELARAQLFGDRTEAALATLDGLLDEGYVDAETLSRKGLALRWLGRSGEAVAVYRRVVREYPESPLGPRGLVQALADKNRLADALEAGDSGAEKFPDDWELRLRRAQVMNWAGLHVQARKELKGAPAEQAASGDVLHHRTLAARWAERPEEAFRLAVRYRDVHPTDPQSARLLRDLSYEYGASAQAEAEAVSDSAGYSYRGVSERVQVPLAPGQHVSFVHGYREYEDRASAPGVAGWNRYTVGWSGALGRRISAYAAASQIDYGGDVTGSRMGAEASISALATDRIRVAAGAGIVPAETLPGLRERLMAKALWASVEARPTLNLSLSARFSQQGFGDGVDRSITEYSAFRTVSRRGGHRVDVGLRGQWMRHNRPSALFWSPRSFKTQLAALRFEGGLPWGVDYAAETGAGVQREHGFPMQTPFVATLEAAKRLRPDLWVRFKGGYSNSSLDRINPGTASYQFRYLSVGLDFRFKGWG